MLVVRSDGTPQSLFCKARDESGRERPPRHRQECFLPPPLFGSACNSLASTPWRFGLHAGPPHLSIQASPSRKLGLLVVPWSTANLGSISPCKPTTWWLLILRFLRIGPEDSVWPRLSFHCLLRREVSRFHPPSVRVSSYSDRKDASMYVALGCEGTPTSIEGGNGAKGKCVPSRTRVLATLPRARDERRITKVRGEFMECLRPPIEQGRFSPSEGLGVTTLIVVALENRNDDFGRGLDRTCA